MQERTSFRLSIPQAGFFVLCLMALSFLIFYLGARFGPKLFWGLSLDEIGIRQSLLPDDVTDEELEALLKEEGVAPTTFYDTLEEETIVRLAEKEVVAPPKKVEKETVIKKVAAAIPPPPQKEEITTVIEKELARYTLKVGSFGSRAPARALQGKLARAGYSASVKTVKIPEKGEWYRVYLGRYPSQSQAESEGKKLQSKYGITPAVVPLTP